MPPTTTTTHDDGDLSNMALWTPTTSHPFPPASLVTRMLLVALSDLSGTSLATSIDRQNANRLVSAKYGIVLDSLQTEPQLIEYESHNGIRCTAAIYAFDLAGMIEMDPASFPTVLQNASTNTPLPFVPHHGTRGELVPSILASRMLHRSTRDNATLDGKYAVCLTHFAEAMQSYTTQAAKIRAIFGVNVKLFKKASRFKKTPYLVAHESWLQLQQLLLVSLGEPIMHIRDFLTTSGSLQATRRNLTPQDVPDDWNALPEALLRQHVI